MGHLKRVEKQRKRTLINVLPLVEGSQGEIVGESAECVDEVSAQVGIDILRQEFGLAGPVSRPIGVVANDFLIVSAGDQGGGGGAGLGRWPLRHCAGPN